MKSKPKTKIDGYWTKQNTIEEANAYVDKYGEQALKAKSMYELGHSSLSAAITKHGGIRWIRQELNLTEGVKPKGYWTEDRILSTAKEIMEESGEEALSGSWLKSHGYGSLHAAISRMGKSNLYEKLGIETKEKPNGFWNSENTVEEARILYAKYGLDAFSNKWLRSNRQGGFLKALTKFGKENIQAQLGIIDPEPRKDRNYWTKENTIREAHRLYAEYGEECIKKPWMNANGYSSLGNAITKHGGMRWMRELLGVSESTKENGYWTPQRTIEEARQIVEQSGIASLTKAWLAKNGNHRLNNAIGKHGGFEWIRKELGLESKRMPVGYWTKETIVHRSKLIAEEYGELALTGKWLRENHYGGLGKAIGQMGGYKWLREQLSLGDRDIKPMRYWSKENTIIEARKILSIHGERCLTGRWLQDNGHGSLMQKICKYGGFGWIRQELQLGPLQRERRSTSIQARRKTNLDKLKKILTDLCIEGIHGFTPAQLIIPLQQAGFNEMAFEEGKDVYLALTNGMLLPEELLAWSKGDFEEPEIRSANLDALINPLSMCLDNDNYSADTGQTTNEIQEPPVSCVLYGSTNGDHADGITIEDDAQLLPRLALIDPNDQLRFLDSEVFASADEEAINALISMGLHQLWAKAYLGSDEAEEVISACKKFDPQRPWSRHLQELFLAEHKQASELPIPTSYNYRVSGELVAPRLMQRHVAARALERRRFLVMSDMGTGKSLAAQLAVMADGANQILVIAINSCVQQWVRDFEEQWLYNEVSLLSMDTIRAFRKKGSACTSTKKRNIWVMPSHLLSLMKDHEIAVVVESLEADAIILDEIHVFKQREGSDESQRRKQTLKLITAASELKEELMVLGLSGTVITNSLNEGKTLLELVTGEERPDLPTGRGIAKAMRMHQALMANGIRQRAANDYPHTVERPKVDASDLIEEVRSALRYPPRLRPLQIEKALIHARIPAIVEAIEGPTVVVTQYVDGFIEPLRKALKRAGRRVGVHTGDEKLPINNHQNAVEAFKAGALDVLLASINTISTGVDGLQNVSNTLVIASMPWTAADYLQVIARLARSGQDKPVRVIIPTTYIEYEDKELGSAQWSFCDYRAGIIATKQRLMDAVMDGLVPESEEITEARAGQELVKWLERLNTKGALIRPFRPITVPLVFADEEEEQKARARFGTWSSCNGRWNSQSSDKLHKRLQVNPEEWEMYHTDLDSLRKEWDVDPLQEAINHCMKSQGLVIGDFGCGTARLADEMQDRHIVHSFDHIAINDKVVACDIASGVPLPEASLDLAIFSLSLMGPNWKEQLVEARRCLKPTTGQVLIWTAASGKDAAEFSSAVESAGFKVVISQAHYKWIHVWAVWI